MTFFTVLALLAIPAVPRQIQQFRLEPGDYRYFELPVKQIPAELECRFQVLTRSPSVHVELLNRSDFHLFVLGKTHGSVLATDDSASASFRHMIDEAGEYELVIRNANEAP